MSSLLTPENPAAISPNRQLPGLPTDTTASERQLVARWFRDRWDGEGHVVEIGPGLGATTRAIAGGMLANPRRSADALLHTYERFDDHSSPYLLREAMTPLVAAGVVPSAEADAICATGDFARLFAAIHGGQEYGRLVRLHDVALPERAEEIDPKSSFRELDGAGKLGALFVNACNSWAATHCVLVSLLPRMRLDAPVIFHEFGGYPSFWITAATHALRDYLTMEEREDATYVFRLHRPITAAGVARRFARTPVEMGEIFFQRAAAALLERSRRSCDLRGELVAQLHHVAALATIGRRGAALELFKAIDRHRYAPFASLIEGCSASPTHLPGGKQVSWPDAA